MKPTDYFKRGIFTPSKIQFSVWGTEFEDNIGASKSGAPTNFTSFPSWKEISKIPSEYGGYFIEAKLHYSNKDSEDLIKFKKLLISNEEEFNALILELNKEFETYLENDYNKKIGFGLYQKGVCFSNGAFEDPFDVKSYKDFVKRGFYMFCEEEFDRDIYFSIEELL